jgi:hypothetical protein
MYINDMNAKRRRLFVGRPAEEGRRKGEVNVGEFD